MARKKWLEESNETRNGSWLTKAACIFPILPFVVFPARAENDA